MGKQPFDHSDFIQGRLNQHQKVAWDTQQVTLSEGPRSLWLMQAMHINHTNGTRGIKLNIERFTKSKNNSLFNISDVQTFPLDENAVKVLFDYLQKQQSLEGIDLGTEYVSIPIKGTVTGMSKTQRSALSDLIARLFNEDNMETLIKEGGISNATLKHINIVSQHIKYRNAVEELESLLETEVEEQVYQEWFNDHTWVFGTQYADKIPSRRIGLHQIADILLKTVDGYLDIFELKRPNMDVLRYDRSHDLYFFSKETSASISQCSHYIRRAEEDRTKLKFEEHMPFLKPRARIIIGRSNDWDDNKKDVLRTLNASLHYIEVMTHDHVHAMAQRLVKQYE